MNFCFKMSMKLLILSIFVCLAATDDTELKFPEDFQFGVASSSYQIEGAWNEDGKGESIWDRALHEKPELITDQSNGDIACDSYHRLEDDLANLEFLGVNFYRFSISWPRILPNGFDNEINEAGVQYYNNLIDGLLARNIEPVLTLYHWDLPYTLHEIGGWPNEILVEYFRDFARIAFKLFGDRVKSWLTFNEPLLICQSSYGTGAYAPHHNLSGIADYMCGRTLLLAHAKVYHLYDEEFRPEQNGRIGITINADWNEPGSDSAEDIEAAETTMQMKFGWWAHPIFSKEGDYPAIMKERVAKNSEEENFAHSRLKPFTEKEIEYIRGTSDFFGLNHYTSKLAAAVQDESEMTWNRPSFERDIGTNTYNDPSWPAGPGVGSWIKVVPWGFRKLLNWIKDQYDNPEVIITENGYGNLNGTNDADRISYHEQYMTEVLKAIHEDGCKISAYTAWSFMDNFSWNRGLTLRFGLFHVDFQSAKRTRVAKDSATMYKNIIQTRVINSTS